MKNQVNQWQNDWRTWVEVDTNALKHNLKTARRAVGPNVKLLVVVKSNAYGHGLMETARVAAKNGADYLGVDSIEEGITLRTAGLKIPILVLGYIPLSSLANLTRFNLVNGAYNRETVLELAKTARQQRKIARIHLKIETGTSRQGVLVEDLPGFINFLKINPRIKLDGVYTHFADTENLTSMFYKKQLAMFQKAIEILKGAGYRDLIRHAASSAAFFLYPETHFDMVRLGISYYGMWPSTQVKMVLAGRGITLTPALAWKTKIAQVKHLKKGTWIGYDRTEQLKKDSVIAILPVGYWDGYDRKLSGEGEVIMRGRRTRVMGRVCMNMMMVDATGIKGVKPEEVVTLLGRSGGEEITAGDIARRIGTIHYEIIARINPLLPRLYL